MLINYNYYSVSRWTIRGRVTNKSNIRNWSNSRGEGKLFSFEIMDESVSNGLFNQIIYLCFYMLSCQAWLLNTYVLLYQGEIKITAFNKEVDKFFSLVEQGKVSTLYSPASIPLTLIGALWKLNLEMKILTNITPCRLLKILKKNLSSNYPILVVSYLSGEVLANLQWEKKINKKKIARCSSYACPQKTTFLSCFSWKKGLQLRSHPHLKKFHKAKPTVPPLCPTEKF